MELLYTINNKEIHKINTTILYNSSYNFNNDAIAFLNLKSEIVNKHNINDVSAIPNIILEDFNCLDLKNKDNLTKIDEIKINVLTSLISNKKVVVFLNVLTYLDSDFKNKAIDYLKRQNKIIINYTTEIEETLLLDYLMVLKDNSVIMEGNTKEILKEEKILKKLGFDLPFIVELSNGLKYYNIIEKTYYDNKLLVEDLWK